ncbi:hypothetical protein D3C84_764040 [compost metagenome]
MQRQTGNTGLLEFLPGHFQGRIVDVTDHQPGPVLTHSPRQGLAQSTCGASDQSYTIVQFHGCQSSSFGCDNSVCGRAGMSLTLRDIARMSGQPK